MTAFANTPAGDDSGSDEDGATPAEGARAGEEQDARGAGQNDGRAESALPPEPPSSRGQASNDVGTSADEGRAGPTPRDPAVDPAGEVPSGESVSKVVSLDHQGFTLLRYRLFQVNESVVKIISVALLEVRGPEDGPEDGQGPGPGGGDVGPVVPGPRGGLDCVADEPAPEGGLLSIFEIFNTT